MNVYLLPHPMTLYPKYTLGLKRLTIFSLMFRVTPYTIPILHLSLNLIKL